MVKVIVCSLGEFVIASQLPQSVAFDGGVEHRLVISAQQHSASGIGKVQETAHCGPRVWSSVDHVTEADEFGI